MKVISFINMKGGVAKTTLAINMADCLVKRHNQHVLIIDVDPQFNATQCLMSPGQYMEHLSNNGDTIVSVFDRPSRTVASAVGAAKLLKSKDLEEIEPVKISDSLDLLPGSLELYRIEMAPGDGRENRLKTFITKMVERYGYDYVIIDTPPTPSVWMTSALIASDYYLIPVKADPISLTGIDLLKSIIEEKKYNFNLSIKCAGLVLTVTEPSTLVYQQAVDNLRKDTYWRKYLYPVDLPKRTEIARLQLKQGRILDEESGVDAKLALTKIVTEFMSRVS